MPSDEKTLLNMLILEDVLTSALEIERSHLEEYQATAD